jgi:Rod binding domain-containing protein
MHVTLPERGSNLDRIMHGSLHAVDNATQLRAKAQKVAEQFESVFARSMVQGLRQSTSIEGEDAGGMFGDGPGSGTYADWFDQNLAESLSKSRRIGIADVLMHEFERDRQIPPDPKAKHAAPQVDAAADAGKADGKSPTGTGPAPKLRFFPVKNAPHAFPMHPPQPALHFDDGRTQSSKGGTDVRA